MNLQSICQLISAQFCHYRCWMRGKEQLQGSGLFCWPVQIGLYALNMHFTGAINIFVFVSSMTRECTPCTHRCYNTPLMVPLKAVQIKINLLTFFSFCFYSKANPQVHQLGWLFNGNELKQNENDNNIKIRNNSIIINSVKKEHIGAYQCYGKNPLGQSVSDEFCCSSIRPGDSMLSSLPMSLQTFATLLMPSLFLFLFLFIQTSEVVHLNVKCKHHWAAE